MTTLTTWKSAGREERQESHEIQKSAAGPNAGRWLMLFVLTEFTLQIALFFFGSSSARLGIRIGCYTPSLLLLFFLRGRGVGHPASWCVAAVVGILTLCLLNPDGGGPIAAAAQSSLYLSVLAPLIWTGKLTISPKVFRNIVVVMWGFYTLSAALGMMQVQYPGVYDGALSENYDESSLLPHVLTRADGAKFIRPKGLSDTPGGAAVGGVYSILLGIGLFLNNRNSFFRAMIVGGFITGLFCIYLSQGRTNLIIVMLAGLAAFVALFKRGLLGKAVGLLTVIAIAAAVGTTLAFAIGGDSTIDRFYTLVADDPSTVVYDNRGKFLDIMLTEDLPQYPLGAGIGRWGMMSYYFGNPNNALWAEMMWQGLLYDGGVPLIIIYMSLLFLLLKVDWSIATTSKSEVVSAWSATVFGHTVAAVAASFVFPIFSIQLGMDVMLLNGAIWAMNRTEQEDRNDKDRSDDQDSLEDAENA